jgi:hypothetical protein
VTSDLSRNQHVSAVSARCLHQLQQLQRIRYCLGSESIATQVRAFFTCWSWVDFRAGTQIFGLFIWQAAANSFHCCERGHEHAWVWARPAGRRLYSDLHVMDVVDVDDRIKFHAAFSVYRHSAWHDSGIYLNWSNHIPSSSNYIHLSAACRQPLTSCTSSCQWFNVRWANLSCDFVA